MDTSQSLKPEDFLSYFQMLADTNADPAKVLLTALTMIQQDKPAVSGEASPLAVDLGCGPGKETAELLRRNWRVLSIDYSQVGIETLLQRPEAQIHKDHLETRVQSFADADWSNAALVAALASLPYGPAATFDAVWQKVVSSLVPGGYFVGHLFGPNHYKGTNHVVRRTRSEVDAMLVGLEVLQLIEVDRRFEDEDGGEPVYYNYFEIIARKPLMTPSE